MKQHIFILFAVFVGAACSQPNDRNIAALDAQKITCPEGARAEYGGWGPNGKELMCKLNHGPFVAAEGGRIVLEGEHKMGRRSGTWKWYDKSGKLQKIEKY